VKEFSSFQITDAGWIGYFYLDGSLEMVVNPSLCYHIRLEWINVTARLLQQAVAFWSRTTAHYGLLLVEGPLDEISSVNVKDPFRDALLIPLSNKLYQGNLRFHLFILQLFNFVLDQESKSLFKDQGVARALPRAYKYSQYVHQSGVAFVQVTGNEFMWLSNRMYVSRRDVNGYATGQVHENPDELREKFICFCQDSKQLSDAFVKFEKLEEKPIEDLKLS